MTHPHPPQVSSGELEDKSARDLAPSDDGGDQCSLATDALMPLLASAWFYGGWVAETYNERQMQAIMEREGWWPIPSESALHQALDGGPRPARIGLTTGSGE